MHSIRLVRRARVRIGQLITARSRRLTLSHDGSTLSSGSGKKCGTVILGFDEDGGTLVLDPKGLITLRSGETLPDALRRLVADGYPTAQESPMALERDGDSILVDNVSLGVSLASRERDTRSGGLRTLTTATGHAVGFLGRAARSQTGRAIADCLADILTSLCFLVLWALVAVVYSAFVWTAVNHLEVHEAFKWHILSYKECGGFGLLIAFLADAAVGMTSMIVRRTMERLAALLFGINLRRSTGKRSARQRRRLRETRKRRCKLVP